MKNPQFVKDLFNNISKDYDFMNDLISLGFNKFVKKSAIKKIKFPKNAKVLDLCTGTADIAMLIAKKYSDSDITAVDFSENMLLIAKDKAKNTDNIEFLQADVLDLPFEDGTFDICVISFGLRNLADLRKGLQEMIRVTKNGGYIVNLDLGKPYSFFKVIFNIYFFKAVPIIAKIYHGDTAPYKYLPESNLDFPSQEELVKIMKEFNLKDIRNYNYMMGTIAEQIARVEK